MIKAKKIHLLLPLLLSLATILPAITLKAQASPMPKLYVDPPSIIDPTLMPPKTFDVNISLADVTNLYGYEFNISFNPSILTCLYLMVNDVLGETSYTADTLASNIKGFVWVKVAYYPPATPITTSAPVALATIHFRVKSPGAFGSYPGHPKWNPACDINRDNRIDIFDVARVVANFGKFCPP